jgi:hypothetical protein
LGRHLSRRLAIDSFVSISLASEPAALVNPSERSTMTLVKMTSESLPDRYPNPLEKSQIGFFMRGFRMIIPPSPELAFALQKLIRTKREDDRQPSHRFRIFKT